MTFSNPLFEAWKAGRPTLGLWCSTRDASLAEQAATVDVDWILWDLQHGQITDADLGPAFRACLGRSAVPIARVAANDMTLIGRALDVGALGVVVPLVNTAEEAAAAVAACRYPPLGIRSYGPNRAGLVVQSWSTADLNQVACIVMVETAAGLANVDAIAATEGVDAILIGPSDLAISLGLAPADRPESHAAAVRTIVAACKAHGKAAGIVLGDGATAKAHIDLGFTFISVATDVGLVVGGLTRELAVARGR